MIDQQKVILGETQKQRIRGLIHFTLVLTRNPQAGKSLHIRKIKSKNNHVVPFIRAESSN